MFIRILFLIGAIILGFGIVRGENSFMKFFELRKSQRILDETVRALESQNDDLDLEIKKLKTSPQYAKKVLRDKYHVTEQNERIEFFPD